MKSFNIKDGLGIKLLQLRHDIAIITGRRSRSRRRAAELGIETLFRAEDKRLLELLDIALPQRRR